MKKYIIILCLLITSSIFAENIPTNLFEMGTTRNEVMFSLGIPPNSTGTKNLSYRRTTEVSKEFIVFIFDDDYKLDFTYLDIEKPDVNNISEEES